MPENHEQGLSRSQFLAGAVSAGGAAAAAGVLAMPALAQREGDPPPGRTYVGGRFIIIVDGVASEIAFTDEGPQTRLVVEEPAGPDYYTKKHLGNVKYNEFSVQCGMGMGKGMYDWIQASFDKGGQSVRKSGAVVAADFNYRSPRSTSFPNAFISELTIPALDAASKDAAKMTLKFDSDSAERKAGGQFPIDTKKQKLWLPANFRLRIDGLDTRRVSRIDSFTIKQGIAEDESGGRFPTIHPTKLEIPNLTFYLPQDDAGPVNDWYQQFVAGGQNSDEFERRGDITLLAPDNRTVYATIGLGGLGIFKVTPEKVEAGSEGIRRVKCELYCEQMTLAFAPAASS